MQNFSPSPGEAVPCQVYGLLQTPKREHKQHATDTIMLLNVFIECCGASARIAYTVQCKSRRGAWIEVTTELSQKVTKKPSTHFSSQGLHWGAIAGLDHSPTVYRAQSSGQTAEGKCKQGPWQTLQTGRLLEYISRLLKGRNSFETWAQR